MRDQAKAKELEKRNAAPRKDQDREHEDAIIREVADFLGITPTEAEYCCGNICPHCQTFLDKAIALVELGHPHHLIMNPMQESMFADALEIFRRDRKEYTVRKQELMNRMR